MRMNLSHKPVSVALAATDHARPAPQGGREYAPPRAGRDPLFFLEGVQPC